MKNEWKNVDILAAALQTEFGDAPEVMLVLGSGLGSVADGLSNRRSCPVSQFTQWPCSTVSGHAGAVHTGGLGSTRVLIAQGRVHLYEGYCSAEVVRSIRAAITWGVKVIVLTNAAGGIVPSLSPGQLMMITDHINLTGSTPLLGPNDEKRGPRFLDLTDVYDPNLCKIVSESANSLGIDLAQGVYLGMLGPTYETPAEVRMLATLGAHAVGMSTVHEAIAARHLGARVAAISCITNSAAGLEGALLDHDDVQRAGLKASGNLATLLASFVGKIGECK